MAWSLRGRYRALHEEFDFRFAFYVDYGKLRGLRLNACPAESYLSIAWLSHIQPASQTDPQIPVQNHTGSYLLSSPARS